MKIISIYYNCIDDGSRSTENAIQVEFSNYPKVLYSKGMVLSIREKATESCQVNIKEMNDHVNHLRKHRKFIDFIKTRCHV